MNRTATYPPKSLRPAMGGGRYFFNGQEGDDEVLGEGVSLTAEFWQYGTKPVVVVEDNGLFLAHHAELRQSLEQQVVQSFVDFVMEESIRISSRQSATTLSKCED